MSSRSGRSAAIVTDRVASPAASSVTVALVTSGAPPASPAGQRRTSRPVRRRRSRPPRRGTRPARRSRLSDIASCAEPRLFLLRWVPPGRPRLRVPAHRLLTSRCQGRALSTNVAGLTPIRIGTCSWADEALSKYFYPPKLPAKERLAYYADHFDTVEVYSTYYRLPSEAMVEGWAERTPPGFTMHVKAFGLMTRHPVKAETIPEDLRAEMPLDERGRVDRPSRELRGEIFRRFLEALEPLRREGKLGGILFQLPPYIVYKESSLDYLEWAREQLGGDEMLVEFRHRSWLDDENRATSLAFLEGIGAGYVVVDAPRSDTARNL